MLALALALFFSTPALAQPSGDEPQVDLESIDTLLGGDDLSGEQPAPDALPQSDIAPPPTEDVQPAEEPPADALPSPEREPTDLDRAYAAYSGCTSDAGRAFTEQGEAIEVVGVRALAACGEERAAYVNAFYFAQLPAPEGVEERELRLRAERLVSQTDSFLIATVTEAATAARNPAPAEPAPEAGAPSE